VANPDNDPVISNMDSLVLLAWECQAVLTAMVVITSVKRKFVGYRKELPFAVGVG